MASARHVLALARAAVTNERSQVFSICRQIIAAEGDRSSLRRELESLLRRPLAAEVNELLPIDLRSLLRPGLIDLSLDDVILPQKVHNSVANFIAERAHADALRAEGLSVPHKLLLVGPPGNGKTSLAGVIAKTLQSPFFALDFSAVVESFMGKTGANLAKIFRGIPSGSVLFIDEMETVLSERASKNTEVGEIARIVSTVLLEIDRLGDDLLLIGATNHAEMLDRAVVRRFDYCWELPNPDDRSQRAWITRFGVRHSSLNIGNFIDELLLEFDGRSLAELENHVRRWARRQVLEQRGRAVST